MLERSSLKFHIYINEVELYMKGKRRMKLTIRMGNLIYGAV